MAHLPEEVLQQLTEARAQINELADSIGPPVDENVPISEVKSNKLDRILGYFANVTGSDDSPILYAIHGGGYWSIDCMNTMGLYIEFAKKIHFNVFLVEYRLVPVPVQFPENVKDVVEGYEYLLYDRKVSPDKIVVQGESAGGGMVAFLMNACMGPNQRHPDQQDNLYYHCPKPIPQPRGAIMSSPWMNFKNDTPTYEANKEADLLDGPFFELSMPFLKYFVAPYTTPEQSMPLGINPTGWTSAVRITAGDTETLLDDVIVYGRKLQRCGVDTSFKIFHNLQHCGIHDESYGLVAEKAKDAFFEEQAQWVRDLFAKSKL